MHLKLFFWKLYFLCFCPAYQEAGLVTTVKQIGWATYVKQNKPSLLLLVLVIPTAKANGKSDDLSNEEESDIHAAKSLQNKYHFTSLLSTLRCRQLDNPDKCQCSADNKKKCFGNCWTSPAFSSSSCTLEEGEGVFKKISAMLLQ